MQPVNLSGRTAPVEDPENSAWLEKRTPAGHRDIVGDWRGACIFLSHDAANFSNGPTFFVDGGIAAGF